ncbi:hypothetical protein STSP2_00161 [Anaerohalosphaera lusitana]|uniref:Uncharacterized protein n=1 Tax=Anaerohalosphaera lusitana TaxID=1936003 RepID=A0A1U9NGG1_9BACT|nr:DUF6599 family protein [Anaerohalosphaera lusitana]AQT67023.1 hypothetical protein STSP2_00161 [Anaerohalosphaera lusitana]
MPKKKTKGRETIFAALTLVALAGIVSAIVVKQFHYDQSRFDPASALPEEQAGAADSSVNLKAALPQGLQAISPPEQFSRDDLYVKINGKAPVYLDAGFEQLHSLRFAAEDAQEKWMEIFVYDMAKPRNAFSVYSIQRRAESELIGVTEFAYKTSNAVFMALGPYYIELVAAEESNRLQQAMMNVAKNLVDKLGGEDTQQIEIFKYLPADGRMDQTLNLHLSNTFGSQALKNIFTVEYETFGEVQAFIAKKDNPDAAEEMAQAYQTFLTDNGAEKVGQIEGCDGGIYDFYGTTEIVCYKDEFLFGVHEAFERDPAEKLAKQILANIQEVTDSASK